MKGDRLTLRGCRRVFEAVRWRGRLSPFLHVVLAGRRDPFPFRRAAGSHLAAGNRAPEFHAESVLLRAWVVSCWSEAAEAPGGRTCALKGGGGHSDDETSGSPIFAKVPVIYSNGLVPLSDSV